MHPNAMARRRLRYAVLAQAHLHCLVMGGQVRVEDVEGSMYASIDLVCDKLRVKLRKMKEKVTDRRHERSRVHVRIHRVDAVRVYAVRGCCCVGVICAWGEPPPLVHASSSQPLVDAQGPDVCASGRTSGV